MFKFGPQAPRSLNSFGVSGLLSDRAQIFYNTVYSTRHIGRVSDLVSARIQSAGGDELRLRSLILYTGIESYRAQLSAENWILETTQILDNPMIVECGIDEEKIAIGISFHLPEGKTYDIGAIQERTQQSQLGDAFEGLIKQLARHADRVVIRVDPKSGRYEILSLIAIPGKMDFDQLPENERVAFVVLEGEPEATPRPDQYVELGDVDYPELLKEDSPILQAKAFKTGEILSSKVEEESNELEQAIRSRNQDETDEAETVPGSSEEEEASRKVSGGSEEEESSNTIRGGADEEEETETVSGTAPDDEESVAVSGGPNDDDEVVQVTGAQSEDDDETIMSGGSEDEDDEEILIAASSSDEEEEILVRGSAEDEDLDTNVQGSDSSEDLESILVKGTPEEVDDSSILVKDGSDGESIDSQAATLVKGSEDQSAEDESEITIKSNKEAQSDDSIEVLESDQLEASSSDKTLDGKTGRDSPNGKKSSEQEEDQSEADSSESLTSEKKLQEVAQSLPPEKEKLYKQQVQSLQDKIKNLEKELEKAQTKTISQSNDSISDEKIHVTTKKEIHEEEETLLQEGGAKDSSKKNIAREDDDQDFDSITVKSKKSKKNKKGFFGFGGPSDEENDDEDQSSDIIRVKGSGKPIDVSPDNEAIVVKGGEVERKKGILKVSDSLLNDKEEVGESDEMVLGSKKSKKENQRKEESEKEDEEGGEGIRGWLRKKLSRKKKKEPPYSSKKAKKSPSDGNEDLEDEDDEMEEAVDQEVSEKKPRKKKKKKKAKARTVEDDESGDESESTPKKVESAPKSASEQTNEVPSESSIGGNADPVEVVAALESDTKKIEKIVQRAASESEQIKQELKSKRSKEWVDRLITELQAEKGRIAEQSRNLAQSVKQKELNFKTHERSLQEELKRKEEMIRQKNAAIQHSKDQIAQMTMNMEKVKDAAKKSAADSHFKKKYEYTQNSMNVLKDENQNLRKKIDDLNSTLSSSRNSPNKVAAEVNSLKQKFERSNKQLEETKRQIGTISVKLKEAEKKAAGATHKGTEMKAKLDQAQRIAAVEKKNSEKFKSQAKEAEGNELKLKRKVIGLENELKALQKKLKRAA